MYHIYIIIIHILYSIYIIYIYIYILFIYIYTYYTYIYIYYIILYYTYIMNYIYITCKAVCSCGHSVVNSPRMKPKPKVPANMPRSPAGEVAIHRSVIQHG